MDLNFFLLQPERLHLKSYREDQVTNLGFSFSKNMLIFPFRKIFLPDLEFVVDSVFLVIYVIPLPSCLHGFWWEISYFPYWDYLFLIEIILYEKSCSFLPTFKIPLVFGFWKFNYNASFCRCHCYGCHYVYPPWNLVCFLTVQILVFRQIWEVCILCL